MCRVFDYRIRKETAEFSRTSRSLETGFDLCNARVNAQVGRRERSANKFETRRRLKSRADCFTPSFHLFHDWNQQQQIRVDWWRDQNIPRSHPWQDFAKYPQTPTRICPVVRFRGDALFCFQFGILTSSTLDLLLWNVTYDATVMETRLVRDFILWIKPERCVICVLKMCFSANNIWPDTHPFTLSSRCYCMCFKRLPTKTHKPVQKAFVVQISAGQT